MNLQDLINHVIFPIRLPSKSSQFEIDESFDKFLGLTCDALDLIFGKYVEADVILRLFNSWKTLQSSLVITLCFYFKFKNILKNLFLVLKFLDSQKVFEIINSLKAGQVFAAYLHSQNSCVLIRMMSEEQNNKSIISSFQTQLDNKTIMSLNGSVQSFFPQFSFCIEKTDFIKSRSFAELLADLCNQPISKSKSTSSKAGCEHVEERDVVSPRFVYEWMSSMLSGYAENSSYPKPVVKKIRDEVLFGENQNSATPFRRSCKQKLWV